MKVLPSSGGVARQGLSEVASDLCPECKVERARGPLTGGAFGQHYQLVLRPWCWNLL
jgi:hypothetical protein